MITSTIDFKTACKIRAEINEKNRIRMQGLKRVRSFYDKFPSFRLFKKLRLI